MKFVMNLGLWALFYIKLVYLTFKCHNHYCYHNRDMSSLRIIICQNSHNRSSLLTALQSSTNRKTMFRLLILCRKVKVFRHICVSISDKYYHSRCEESIKSIKKNASRLMIHWKFHYPGANIPAHDKVMHYIFDMAQQVKKMTTTCSMLAVV